MPNFKCYLPPDPDALYLYCPSFGAAVTFSCLFGLVTIAHIIQAVLYKKPFTWVLIMGSLWEFGGYVSRSLSVADQKNVAIGTTQSLLILLSPLWINAFVYMLLGRMVQFFLDDRRVYRIKAKNFTWIFVSLDIATFVVQAIGGLEANSKDVATAKTGLHVYMGGIGFQETVIIAFTCMAYRFQRKLAQQERQYSEAGQGISMTEFRSPQQARKLLYLVYTALGLITLRIIFRLIEYSQGFTSALVKHEWFPYVFDAAPMLIAILTFNILHPGRILRGPNSDFTEEKALAKEEKRAKKELKKMEKETKKAAKMEEKEMKKAERNAEKERKKAVKLKGKDNRLGEEGLAYSDAGLVTREG
jgi:RTA1 like protein